MAAIEPEQDPQYLSFQRALGFDDADARAVAARRKASLFRDQQYRLPEFADQYDDATKAINNDYAARGVYGSGVRGTDLGTVLNRNVRQVGEYQANYADQQGTVDTDLARQLAANQRQLAEEALNARGRLAMDAANVGQR